MVGRTTPFWSVRTTDRVQERNRKVLSHLLSALSLARHAVALTLIASAAATTMVAGAVDQTGTQPQHETAPMTSIAPTTKPEPTTSARAEPQARVTRRSWACPTSLKICAGSEFIGAPRS